MDAREAFRATNGDVVPCIHCGDLVGLDEEPLVAGGRVLHERCYDVYFGSERQDQLQG